MHGTTKAECDHPKLTTARNFRDGGFYVLCNYCGAQFEVEEKRPMQSKWCTRFRLRVLTDDIAWVEKRIAQLRRINENALYALDIQGNCAEPWMWLDWQADLEDFTRRYRKIALLPEGEELDSKNNWRAYFLNGQSVVQKAELVYPEPPEWARV